MKIVLETIKGYVSLAKELRTRDIYHVVLLVIITYILLCLNNKMIDYTNYLTKIEQNHELSIKQREYVSPRISNNLLKLINGTGCDYAIEAEYHNGDKSLNGLSFKKFTMLYEEPKQARSVLLAKEYQHQFNSLYKFTSYLYENGFFNMSIKELRNIDKRLANELDLYDIKRVIAYNFYIDGNPAGFLMILYKNDTVIENNIMNSVYRCSNDIAKLLSEPY